MSEKSAACTVAESCVSQAGVRFLLAGFRPCSKRSNITHPA